MTIGKLEGNPASVSAQRLDPEIDTATRSDADWFKAALELPAPAYGAESFSEKMMDPLARRAFSLEDMSKDAGKALREASLNADPEKFMKASRALSTYYLQTSLSVKMISKGSQALDKLTNMQ
jgi:type III secretion system YscI/HrpB-like protein